MENAPKGRGSGECGDGVRGSGENCEVGTLNCGNCMTEGFDLGALRCSAGTCTSDTSGCSPFPGALVGGHCWVLGNTSGLSWDAICGAQGLASDEAATRDYAGSGGTLTNCRAVIDALVPATAPHNGSDLDVSGCGPDLGIGRIYSPPDPRNGFPAEAVTITAPTTTCTANGEEPRCSNFGWRPCARVLPPSRLPAGFVRNQRPYACVLP